MTTYILCGGNNQKSYENFGSNLANVVENLAKKPRILDCFFARDEGRWQEMFLFWEKLYQSHFSEFSQEIATFDNFLEQIKSSDVIFFHGGSTATLLKNISRYKNLRDALNGKIVIGSSAGTNFLSINYLSHSGITEGLKILPFNIVVHYNSENERESRTQADVDKLLRQFPNTPTLLLREGEFSIFQKGDKRL